MFADKNPHKQVIDVALFNPFIEAFIINFFNDVTTHTEEYKSFQQFCSTLCLLAGIWMISVLWFGYEINIFLVDRI